MLLESIERPLITYLVESWIRPTLILIVCRRSKASMSCKTLKLKDEFHYAAGANLSNLTPESSKVLFEEISRHFDEIISTESRTRV